MTADYEDDEYTDTEIFLIDLIDGMVRNVRAGVAVREIGELEEMWER